MMCTSVDSNSVTSKMVLVVLFNCFVLAVGVRGGILEGSYSVPTLMVIDTDGGIDDSLAMLLILASQERAQLLAVTCVFGDTDIDNACNNALRMLVLANRQAIPVHKGSSGPITTGKYVPELINILGIDGLGNRSQEFSTGGQQLSGTPAALALSWLARAHPGSITVLAIGPLTNLALAHRIDPYFTHHLKEIVIMGGNYNGIVTDSAEFNFKSDPLAANIILTEAACPLTIVPYETTIKNGIPWDKYQELTGIDTRLGRFFQRVTEVESVREHARGDGMYIVYDFVAAAVVIHPEIVTSEVRRTLAVEYEGVLTEGRTVVLPDNTWRKASRIITDVNGTTIVELFQRMLVGS